MNKKLIVPILTILVGVTWLLNVLNIIPGVDWIWTAGLAAIGLLCLAIGGVNKLTVVIGPFFLAGSVCSLLRQTGKLALDREIPILVIILGVLMLVSQLSPLSLPKTLQEEKTGDR
jgi:amino acid transporter